MRQSVVNEQLDEMDVHPPNIYQNFVDICATSAYELLDQSDDFVDLNFCPACNSENIEHAFKKHGYEYCTCLSCSTIFISPRPSQSMLNWYLNESPTAAFRNSDEYWQGMEIRINELINFRARWISELCTRFALNSNGPIVDVETRLIGYLNELERLNLTPIISAKPLTTLRDNFDNTPELVNLDNSNARVVTAFDNLEHQINPLDLVQASYNTLSPGGLLIITTRSGSGFDIQVLWEHCSTIFPIEHINLISIEGMKALLKRTGFEIIEISTPGQIDVQMIERVLNEGVDIEIPRFLRYFFTHRDKYAKHRLQQFLQENLLSSYMRVVARKVIEK